MGTTIAVTDGDGVTQRANLTSHPEWERIPPDAFRAECGLFDFALLFRALDRYSVGKNRTIPRGLGRFKIITGYVIRN